MNTEIELDGRTYPIIDGVLDLGNTQVSDISPLKGMALRRLWLNNTQVSDISPLTVLPLEWFSLSNTPASKNPLPQWLDKKIVFIILEKTK